MTKRKAPTSRKSDNSETSVQEDQTKKSASVHTAAEFSPSAYDRELSKLRKEYDATQKNKMEPLIAAAEVAAVLTTTEDKVAKLAEALLIPGYWLDGEWRFDLLEVRASLKVVASVIWPNED